jgi:DNA-binding NarL/FixJ family response regulator
MPPPTTVLLFSLPGLLHDVLGQLAAAGPAAALVDARAGEDLLGAAARTQADVIIATQDAAPAATVERLLAERPRTRLLAVSADGRRGVVHELRAHRVELGELSTDALLAVIGPRGS